MEISRNSNQNFSPNGKCHWFQFGACFLNCFSHYHLVILISIQKTGYTNSLYYCCCCFTCYMPRSSDRIELKQFLGSVNPCFYLFSYSLVHPLKRFQRFCLRCCCLRNKGFLWLLPLSGLTLLPFVFLNIFSGY